MITFKQFLSEEKVSIDLNELIEKKCMPFLRQSQRNGLLYRAVNNTKNYAGTVKAGANEFSFYVFPVRKDRYPMSMPKYISRIIDDWFEDKMGIRARSQAVFCYGEKGRELAEDYGNYKMVLFPVGKFTYTWSPKVKDLYNDVSNQLVKYDDKTEKYNHTFKTIPHDGNSRYDRDKIYDWLNSQDYTINKLDSAVSDDMELMIDCDEWIGVEYYHTEDLDAIRRALGIKHGGAKDA